MGLRDWWGRRKALRATPAVLEALQARQVNPYPAIGGTNLTSQAVNSVYVEVQNATYGWIYASSPSVRRVIDYIASNVAQLGLKVYERISDDEREQRGEHPAAEWLRRPNAQTPGEQFVYEFVTDWLIYDNAYALKLQAGSQRRLIRLAPHRVGVVGRMGIAPEAYRVWNEDDGTFFDVPPEDVLHWRGYSYRDQRRGESKLETLREELAADAAARQANTELHKSGLSLPGWIERPLEAPEWSREARQRFEEDWANRAKQGKRRSPVLEEGMEFKNSGGVSPEDAELLDARRFTVEQVAGIYGMKHVPPESEEERRQFYADVLPPLLDRLSAFLNLQILQAEFGDEDHYFEFNLDEKLMGDDRLKALVSGAGGPVLTRNEARARLNLPAKKGGDELVTPLNVTQGGKPSPQIMPPQDPNRPSQDGDARDDDAPTPIPARNASQNGNGKALLAPRRAAQLRRRDAYASEFEGALREFLARQERTLKSRRMDAKAIADERWERELAEDLFKTARGVVAREGGIAAARIGLDDIDVERTEGYLKTLSQRRAVEITKAVREALADGEPEEVFAQARNEAAPRAGMTLATTTAAFAVREAGEQAPDSPRRLKTWIVTSANSAHPEMDGESVPLYESFSNGEQAPPADHPGCACLLEIT